MSPTYPSWERGKSMVRLMPTYDTTQLVPELKDDVKARVIERLAEMTISKMEEVRYGEDRHFR